GAAGAVRRVGRRRAGRHRRARSGRLREPVDPDLAPRQAGRPPRRRRPPLHSPSGAARSPGRPAPRRPGPPPAHPARAPPSRRGAVRPRQRARAARVGRRPPPAPPGGVRALALVPPLITVGVLPLVRQPPVHDQTQRPALTRLTGTTVVCPAP